MSKVIAFFSQKGGCGKSTLAVITASYLAYVKHCKVAVVDGDFQGSFYKKRSRELTTMNYFEERVKELGITEFYPVFYIGKPAEISDKINELRNMDYEYIIVDLPGQISDAGVLKAVINCEIIIVPLEHDPAALASSLESTLAVTHKLMPSECSGSKIETVAGVFNKIPYSQAKSLSRLVPMFVEVKFNYIFRNIIGRVDRMDDDRCCTVLPPADQFLEQQGSGLNFGGYLNELYDNLLNVKKG